jgi:RNA polymerase sigma-70 factor (ECF subfamily)
MVGDAAEPRERVALPSFDVLYEEYFDLVWRTARRLGVPEAAADDAAQDAFLVLHRRAADYDGRTPVRSWLLGIVVRVVSDHRRRYKRKDAPCVPHAADSQGDVLLASSRPTPSAEAEQGEAVRLLDQLLSELDERRREVLVLAELEEMTVPEIAEVLGANVNTIYATLRAARRDFDAAHARHNARTKRRTP